MTVPIVFLAMLVFLGTAEAQTCGQGLQFCPAGGHGPGGCYKLAYKKCEDGVVMDVEMSLCRKGAYGGGGPYRGGYRKCVNGAVILPDMQWCPKGRLGDGGEYKPPYTSCNQGRIERRL